MDTVQPVWEFVACGDGILAAAREPELWRVRSGPREASHRLLDVALEELLGFGNREIATLTVRILDRS